MSSLRAVLFGSFFVLTSLVSAQAPAEKEFQRRVTDAVALYKGGDVAGATKAFEALNGENPRSSDVQAWLGFLYLRADAPAKAVPLLEKAAVQQPTNLEILNNLGNAYMAADQPDKALAQYVQVAKLSPRMFEPHYNMGTIHLRRKQYPKAIASFQAAAKLNPQDPFVQNNLGVAFEAQKDWTSALGAFKRAADLRPDNRLFARNTGLVMARLRRPEAVTYLERASGDGGDDAVLLPLSEAYARAGRTADALQLLEKARAAQAKNSIYWFNLAVLRNQTGDSDGAVQAYRRAIELNPSDLDSLNNLGLLHFRAGRFREAAVLFDKLSGLNPNSINAKMNLGAAAANSGDLKKAIAVWKEVIKAEPTRTGVRLDLANALWETGDVEGARQQYLQVLSTDKNHAEALNGIGLSHLRAGKLPQAEAAFRTATEAKPKFMAAHNNLAIALERMGRRDDAIKVLERAAKIDPADEDIQRNLQRMRSAD